MKKYYFLILVICCSLLSVATMAQVPFTQGNVVVVRLGDGTPVTPAGTVPMFLDEYSPAGTLVQSIALPTTDNGANLRMSQDYGRGDISLLTLSPNKQFLSLVGFTVSPGASTASINTTSNNRTIARIDYTGTVNSSTSILGSDLPNTTGTTGLPVSAITDDGTRFWVVHESNLGCIRYCAFGQSSSTSVVNAGQISTLNIENGQLYSTYRARPLKIGSGLPTSGPAALSLVPGEFTNGFGSASQAFYADLNPSIPGNDVLYISENSDHGLSKWSLDPSTNSWILNGTIGNELDLYVGLTGVVNGTSVTLYCNKGIDRFSNLLQGQLVTLTDNTGHNLNAGTFTGTPTVIATPGTNKFFKGLAMAPLAPPLRVSVKAYLQGAYSTALGMHKAVTANWAAALNTGALIQPYNTAVFGNYAGTESKTAGSFAATAATTDYVDWVLLELRDATTPSTVIARRAALIREDGMVVETDGSTDVLFNGVPAGNYFVVVRHRNHLSVRSATAIALNENTATTYDFTTAQNKAFQDPAILTNAAQKDVSGTGVFGMWAGNANSNTTIRSAGGTSTVNDFLYISNIGLGGNVANTQGPPAGAPVYATSDVNMDGSVRAVGGTSSVNDFLFLWNIALSGNIAQTITAHQ